MEQRKAVVKVIRKKIEEKPIERKKKEPRPVTRQGLIEFKNAGKKLTKGELLFIDGKRFYSFAQDIEFMETWFDKCSKLGIKPNDRIKQLIEGDI